MSPVGPIFLRAVLGSLFLSLAITSNAEKDVREVLCVDGTQAVLEHTAFYMGKNTTRWACNTEQATGPISVSSHKKFRLKDFNLCTADCKTYCDHPVLDGAPNKEDCKALASYYKDAGRFTIDAHKYIIWEYDTCRVTQYNRLNHADQRISYCFDQDHWAGVVDRVSSRCGLDNNAHGGTCFFYDSLHFSSITIEKV